VTAAFAGDARELLERHRVAHLATADRAGVPHVIPLCYALDGDTLYFVVDAKPKRRAGTALKRMQNLLANPQVALVVDDYGEDWSTLAYVLVRGRAAVVRDTAEAARALAALRIKYPQYRAMALDGPEHPVVRIAPEHVHVWHASTPRRER
jgi:PPOX class probable F420-dependent enzyme